MGTKGDDTTDDGDAQRPTPTIFPVTITSQLRRQVVLSPKLRRVAPSKGVRMIILGLILLIIGYVAGISLLYYIGGILLIVGVVLLVLGRTGRAVGGRAHWF